VEEEEDLLEHVDERLEDVRGDEGHGGGSGSRRTGRRAPEEGLRLDGS
jgi:hypothetical protein